MTPALLSALVMSTSALLAIGVMYGQLKAESARHGRDVNSLWKGFNDLQNRTARIEGQLSKGE